MSSVALACTFQDFFEHVASSQNSALLLDYDGTIAPFTVERDHALPYPGVQPLLCDLKDSGTRVVVVTGRSAGDIQTLLGIPALEVWGCHGAERILASGEYVPLQDSDLTPILDATFEALEREGLGNQVEVKTHALAVHWRGLPASEAAEARTAALRAMSSNSSSRLGLHDFDGGLELRPNQFTKANAVRQILSEMPGAPIAYLGDDLTDEDAFMALGRHGLTVLVRPEYRPTRAQLWLRPPDELLPFLGLWLSAAGGSQ